VLVITRSWLLCLLLAGLAVPAGAAEAIPDRGLYRDLIQEARAAIVSVRGDRRGTGVVISADGLVVTSCGVVTPGPKNPDAVLEVIFPGGRVEPAVLVGSEARSGVSLLQIHRSGLAHLAVDGDLQDLWPGETVFTLTDATGSIDRDYQVSASVGVVHSRLRLLEGEGYAAPALELTAASTNQRNAGGAVIDVQGRLRGILNPQALHRVGTFLGTAVPARTIAAALERIRSRATVESGYLGGVLTRRVIEQVVVLEVPEGSPMEVAGLRVGDVILEAAGNRLDHAQQLHEVAASLPPGSHLPLLVRRGDELLDVELVVGELPPPGYLGVEWEDDDRPGLKVAAVKNDSPVVRQRGRPTRNYLRKDDRVTRINGTKVDDLDDLEELRSQLYEGAQVRIAFSRGRTSSIIDLTLPAEPGPAAPEPEPAATEEPEPDAEPETEPPAPPEEEE
jgi:S1-C subfamily serine protease